MLEVREMRDRLKRSFRSLGWLNRAACRDADSEMFFVDPGQTVFAPKFLCGRCPVRMDCLEFCLRTSTHNTDHGIFGGLTSSERSVLRSDLRKVASEAVVS